MDKTKKVLREASSLYKSFAHKIKTVEEVRKLIGDRPRKKKVVMCHGTFDIVHPGHVRQLIYSKSKGDILVVSVTIDKYVVKDPGLRPYVPQELRALNLAAFEIVDYVIIDANPTPIENILKLQPDYFVKGFEYSTDGVHPKTREEIETLSSYGGRMVFSPGDIVYSSTKLLSMHAPNLAHDQLLALMSQEGITFTHLISTINKFKKLKIHVVGDLIVDKYSNCSVLGPSQKSPSFSVRLDESNLYIGGAGVVAKHLSALGAQVTLTTVLGEDETAEFAIKDLKESGVKVNAFIDPARPTTLKERFLTDGSRILLQVDKVDNREISGEIVEKICKNVSDLNCDAVICSDFRHGIFNSETIPRISQAIPLGTIKIADSQVSNRWGNILDFARFDLITPNEREARFALGDQDTGIRPLAQKLYNRSECRYLILKLGADGLIAYRSPGIELHEYFYIHSFANEVVDPIGAGDALLAATATALSASKNIVEATILGNLCAAIECSKVGNIPISAKELLGKISDFKKDF